MMQDYITTDTKEFVRFTAPHGRDDDRGYSLDGYDWMEAAGETHWFALSSWGKDGWDAGSWPYTIITLARGKDHIGPFFGVTTYCEGDLDTRFFRDQYKQWEFITEWCRWGWEHGQGDGPRVTAEQVAADREKYGRPYGDEYDGKVPGVVPPTPEGFKAQARRQKRMRSGRTLTFSFTWEGGEYVEVSFEGYVPHDVINMDGVERTAGAFRDRVKAYMKGLDQGVALAAWEDRKVQVNL